MALLTVTKELALAEAGKSAFMSSVFHRLAGNSCLCTCVLHLTTHSMLAQVAQKFCACRAKRMVIISAEFGGKQSHEVGPCFPTERTFSINAKNGKLRMALRFIPSRVFLEV